MVKMYIVLVSETHQINIATTAIMSLWSACDKINNKCKSYNAITATKKLSQHLTVVAIVIIDCQLLLFDIIS